MFKIFVIFQSILLQFIFANGHTNVFRESDTFFEDLTANDKFMKNNKRADERINLSAPGTKWCGPGNTATDYNDLGEEFEVDMCCRDHDHCDNIPAGGSAHNLTNNDYFTRLHCNCDKEFYKCLHTINSKASNRIGYMYFLLRDKCYKEDYPIVECLDYETKLFIRRCARYVLDQRKSKMYQWFDLPMYYGKNETMITNLRIGGLSQHGNGADGGFEEFWSNFIQV